jgi:hypothetical protein
MAVAPLRSIATGVVFKGFAPNDVQRVPCATSEPGTRCKNPATAATAPGRARSMHD